jgi:hypothetical protein
VIVVKDAIPELVEVLSLLVVVGVTRVAYGGQTAGALYVLITVAILFGIYTSANYWNVRYTVGFVMLGMLLTGVPGIIPQLVPPQFAKLSTVASVVFLLAIGTMIADKW